MWAHALLYQGQWMGHTKTIVQAKPDLENAWEDVFMQFGSAFAASNVPCNLRLTCAMDSGSGRVGYG